MVVALLSCSSILEEHSWSAKQRFESMEILDTKRCLDPRQQEEQKREREEERIQKAKQHELQQQQVPTPSLGRDILDALTIPSFCVVCDSFTIQMSYGTWLHQIFEISSDR